MFACFSHRNRELSVSCSETPDHSLKLYCSKLLPLHIHQWNIRCSLSAVALVEMMRFSSFRSVMFLSETVYGCGGRLLSLSVFFFPILEICFTLLTSCLVCGIFHPLMWLFIYIFMNEWEKVWAFFKGSLESIVIFSTFWIKFICPFL